MLHRVHKSRYIQFTKKLQVWRPLPQSICWLLWILPPTPTPSLSHTRARMRVPNVTFQRVFGVHSSWYSFNHNLLYLLNPFSFNILSTDLTLLTISDFRPWDYSSGLTVKTAGLVHWSVLTSVWLDYELLKSGHCLFSCVNPSALHNVDTKQM